ncbi:MAG: hypothetical protein ACLGG7_13440, partial [Bacteriovoracia bacterium]
MKRNLIPTALSCVLAVACQGGGGDSKKSNLPGLEVKTEVTEAGDASAAEFTVTAERAVKLRKDFANIEAFADQINTYNISVSASRAVVGATLGCKKVTAQSFEADQVSGFSALNGTATVSFDLFPADLDAVEVSCSVKDVANTELLSFKKTLRKGYAVRGTQHLRSLGSLDIDTLVMLENSELIFGAEDTALKVGTLISMNGAFSTFRKSDVSKTAAGMNGESGGRLFVSAIDALGEVTFNLRGKDAGIQDKKPVQPNARPRAASGDCSRGNCNGADGARGADAVNGFDGFTGGDSGSANLNVLNPTELIARFIYEPGKGSMGSDPSLPGRGGEGGAPDSVTTPGRRCPTFMSEEDIKCGAAPITRTGKPGAWGPDGAPGVRGATGADGRNLKSILSFEASAVTSVIKDSWSNFEGDL